MRPTYRAKNKDGTKPNPIGLQMPSVAPDGWRYFYDVGEDELELILERFDIVELVPEKWVSPHDRPSGMGR